MGENIEYIQKNRVNILLKILKLLVFVVSMYSIVRLLEKNYFQAIVDISYVSIAVISYYILQHNTRKYTIIARFVFFISILVAIIVLVHLHNSPMRFLWLATIVYMIFYLFDRKEGIFWTIYIAMLLFALMIYDKRLLDINWIDFIILITNIIVVMTISTWYANIEKESTKRFEEAKNMLTREVEHKTLQLKAKTKELQELNDSLEEKISQKIEESRKHEEILFKQAKFAQIGEMINMIAHQWRQPLNAISATSISLGLMIEKQKEVDKKVVLSKLNRMGKYIQDLSKTIDDFRITYNENRYKDKVNVKDVIDNVIELFKNDLNYRNIDIKIDYQCELVLNIYRNKFAQVLVNIIKNSEEAFISNGVQDSIIWITTYCDNNHIYVSIKDNAGGIKKNIIDKIFDPYFTTKENFDGTGLGLYVSKIIIQEKLNGDIWVESDKNFTTFYIKIPK